MNVLELFEGVKGKLGTKKGGTILFVVGIVGILLIFLSSFFGQNKKQATTKTGTEINGTMTAEQYCSSLETKVKTLVQKITGDPDCVVVITLQSSTEYIYADQTKNDTDKSENKKDDTTVTTEQSDKSEQNYIIVKTADGSEKALVVTELMPGIRGVAIVCSGIDAATADQVQQSVMAVLNISSSKIFVSARMS